MAPERKNGVQKRKTDKSGLGRAIINRKNKMAKILADPTLVCSADFTLSDCLADFRPRLQHSTEIAAGLRSVTQENDLDEFLSTAALADTDFAAGEYKRTIPSLSCSPVSCSLRTPKHQGRRRPVHRSRCPQPLPPYTSAREGDEAEAVGQRLASSGAASSRLDEEDYDCRAGAQGEGQLPRMASWTRRVSVEQVRRHIVTSTDRSSPLQPPGQPIAPPHPLRT